MPAGEVPLCAECGQMIWPTETDPPRGFLWYEGDKDDDPLVDELCRGGLTHARCADAFGAKIAHYAL